jgi:peptidoglycan/xylan/chitin deacetylase (PgdA/CDA1 family)
VTTQIQGLARLRLELRYFSGAARLAEWRHRGAGAILRFERVRPARAGRFQPLRNGEISPRFLDRAIRAIRRWNYEFVSIEDVSQRIRQRQSGRRFACLTFDGASKDLITFAYPVLARHGVPFTLYLPTAFPDGLGEAWWLALEQVIARHQRIALVIDRAERRFDTSDAWGKLQAFTYLAGWLRSLPAPDLSAAINDLCKRYSVDLMALTRDAALDWNDIATLAADPNVTIGSATVNYPILANLDDTAARREITMGRAVAEAALHRPLPHLAYPFGDPGSVGASPVRIAEAAGFASAVTAQPGLIDPLKAPNLHALPRIAWDGRLPLRALRVLLAGQGF